MTKSQLVTQLAAAEDLSQAKARSVVDTLLDLTVCGVIEHGKAQLHGFGRFKTVKRPARGGHDYAINFRPGNDFLRRINLK